MRSKPSILILSTSFIVVLLSFPSYGQEFDLAGGFMSNSFSSKLNSSSIDYKSEGQNGMSLAIGISTKVNSEWNIRINFRVDQYGGYGYAFREADYRYGALETEIEFEKTTFHLTFIPINIELGGLCISLLGLDAGILVSKSAEGYLLDKGNWRPGSHDKDRYEILDGNSVTMSRTIIGLYNRIAFRLPMSNHVFLCPQYAFYISLQDEFSTEFGNARDLSIRNYLMIGLGYSIGGLE